MTDSPVPATISAEYYKKMLHAGLDCFAISDSSGNILDVNDSYCQLLGYTRDELTRMNIVQVEAEETPEVVKQHREKVMSIGRDRFETQHRAKNGALIFIDVCAIYSAEEKLFFILLRDISLRIKVKLDLEEVNNELKDTQAAMTDLMKDARTLENELKEKTSLLQATLDSIADGILVVDLHGKIVHYNQRFVTMWQMPTEIMAAKDDKQALDFALSQLTDPAAFMKKVQELYSQIDAESFDVLLFKDGRIFERYSLPQSIEGRSVGRVWRFLDITGRKKAEEQDRQHVAELEEMNKLMVGRELKMAELKQEIEALKQQIGTNTVK